MGITIGTVGIDHLHIFEIVQGLIDAGATPACHVPDGGYLALYEGWLPDSRPVSFTEMLADDSIDVVVTAAIPSLRAKLAVDALQAGKSVLTDKPGVTTADDLQNIRRAVQESGGRWAVLFTERWENRAIFEATRLAAAGEIGDVVAISGVGPHTLDAEHRPEWFFDREQTGGILVDIGSHQVDQFLAVTGSTAAVVTHAAAGNVTCPDKPQMEDIGSLRLTNGTTVGEHRVDYLSPGGLGTWGDVRLSIIGTEGTLEARANVDPGGASGAEHLIKVDATQTTRIDCSAVELDWATRFCADIADGGHRLMTQDHVFAVSEITLAAREIATGWGTP